MPNPSLRIYIIDHAEVLPSWVLRLFWALLAYVFLHVDSCLSTMKQKMVYLDYVKQRILSHHRWGKSYQEIIPFLAAEGYVTTKVGVYKFLQHYQEMGTISHVPGIIKVSKMTTEARWIHWGADGKRWRINTEGTAEVAQPAAEWH